MRFGSKAVIGAGALVGTLALGTSAHAYLSSLTINKCLAAKMKNVGRSASARVACYGKDSAHPDPVALAACLAKADDKWDGDADPAKGIFEKLEAKYPPLSATPCLTFDDTGSSNADLATYAGDVDTDVGDTLGKCDAAKKKCLGKYVAAIGGCYVKAAGKAPGTVDNAPGGCTSKAGTKLFDGIKGCLDKAATNPDCTNVGNQGTTLKMAADVFIQAQACALDPANPGCIPPTPTPTATPTVTPTPTVTATPICGDGLTDPTEPCDPSVPSASWAQCGQDFTCTASCNCACPTEVHFAGDPTDPASILATGFNGLGHRAPVISNGDVTLALACPGGGTARPCGTCTVSGPIANTGTNQLRNQRCTADTSVQCTNAPGGTGGPCTGLGTCEFFFGAPLPLVAGGVGTCVESIFNGSVSGTTNVETGAAVTVALLTWRVHAAVISTDTPCPICVGDATINDNVQGGTCTGGPRATLLCDGNGMVPSRPDFGTTSFDCPPPAATIAVLPIDLSHSTGTVSKTLSATSPNCSDSGFPAGTKCVCDTCNNINAEPCDANADCPPTVLGAGICGGRRCIGGTNDGGPLLAGREHRDWSPGTGPPHAQWYRDRPSVRARS